MKRKRGKQNRRGAAIVEMALVLPIFVMVLLGIVEFGRAMMVGQLVTNAAREGARLAILNGSTNTDVQQSILDFLQNSASIDAADVTVTLTITAAPGNDDPGNQLAASQPGDLVTVRVEVPFDKVSYIASNHLAGRNLTGQAAMRHE